MIILTHGLKNGKDNCMKMVKNKILFFHPKLKLCTFFWGQGECEWSLLWLRVYSVLVASIQFVTYTMYVIA